MTQLSKQIHLLILAALLVSIGMAPAAAQGTFEEVSTEDTLYIRGLISKVYPDTMQISIKPAKGKRVRVTIDPDTIIEGVSQIDELEKEQQVKVWYSPHDGNNRAIKIKKMMDLGC